MEKRDWEGFHPSWVDLMNRMDQKFDEVIAEGQNERPSQSNRTRLGVEMMELLVEYMKWED